MHWCFIVLDFLWATARKSPQRRAWGQALHWCALTCLLWNSLFLGQVKEGQSIAAWMGAAGLGGLNKCQAQKFLPETTACLLTPLFLQIRIVYTLINKLYLGLAGCHVSTMEIISVREKMCLSVKHFWIYLLSLYNSWYGQNCTQMSCLPFRRELMYCYRGWKQAFTRLLAFISYNLICANNYSFRWVSRSWVFLVTS